MHAATRRCGHPADSSHFSAGAAGAATSTPSSLRRWSVRGLRLTPSPISAGDPDCACLRYATNSSRSAAAVSAQANCDGPSVPPVRDSLPPRWAAGRSQSRPRANCVVAVTAAPTPDPHSPSVSTGDRSTGAGHPQCRPRANCDGCAYPRLTFLQCVTGLRGPGAHSLGQL